MGYRITSASRMLNSPSTFLILQIKCSAQHEFKRPRQPPECWKVLGILSSTQINFQSYLQPEHLLQPIECSQVYSLASRVLDSPNTSKVLDYSSISLVFLSVWSPENPIQHHGLIRLCLVLRLSFIPNSSLRVSNQGCQS